MALLTDLNEREQIQNRFERKKPQNSRARSHMGCHGWEGEIIMPQVTDLGAGGGMPMTVTGDTGGRRVL